MCKKIYFLFIVFFLSACTIKQTIEPAEITKNSEICIIENPAVRSGFLVEFKSVLSSKGIPFIVVSETAIPPGCEWTARYSARWAWDLALYMVYAEIKIFHNGNLDGVAIYDATQGSGNLSKFIDAEPKIRELVNELMTYKSAFWLGRTFG